MSHDQRQKALFNAIGKLLRPLVRVLLRNGIPYAAFADVAKHVYVDVAAQEFNLPGRKQTNSRIATITGLSRKEVQRIGAMEGIGDPIEIVERYHRAARVVSGWMHAARFAGRDGQPLPLPFEGGEISFVGLVKAFSGDMPPRAVLDELLQAEIVQRQADGKLALLSPSRVTASWARSDSPSCSSKRWNRKTPTYRSKTCWPYFPKDNTRFKARPSTEPKP